MLVQRAYDDVAEFDSIVQDAGAIASVADNGSGKCRVTTTGVHGIHARQVTEGHKILVSGAAVEATLNTTHTVTAVITVNSFDTDIDFVQTDTAAFVVEKIYIMTPALRAAIGVLRGGAAVSIAVAFQEIKTDDKHNSNTVWIDLDTSTDDYPKGDNHMITGFKVYGNPATTVKIVVSQADTW